MVWCEGRERNKGNESHEYTLTNQNHKKNNLKPDYRRQEKSKTLYIRSDFATLIGQTHIPATSLLLSKQATQLAVLKAFQIGTKIVREICRSQD